MGSKRSARSRRIDSSEGSKKTYIIIGLIATAFLAGFAALVIVDARQKSMSGPPDGVRTYDVGPAGQHTEGEVDYDQSPPVGAVWITYSPNLPQDQVQRLREIAQSNNYVLVSPYPGLQSPVVASAWGKQLTLESADDPNLERFVRAFSQGPQTPEPGAACSGGVGEPQ